MRDKILESQDQRLTDDILNPDLPDNIKSHMIQAGIYYRLGQIIDQLTDLLEKP